MAETQWLEAYTRSFVNGENHAFILHGDVAGIAYETIAHRDLLLATIAATARRQVVARYDIANGVRIESPNESIDERGNVVPQNMAGSLTRRERALQLMGLDQPDEGAGDNPYLKQAVAALDGQGEADPLAALTQPANALPALGKLLRAGVRVAVVIEWAEMVMPDTAMGKGSMSPADRLALVTLLSWAKDRTIGDSDTPIFLLTSNIDDLHPDLRALSNGWRAIDVALPDREARARYLAWLSSRYEQEGGSYPALKDNLTLAEIANLTAGLSLRNLEDVTVLAENEGGMARALLKRYKDDVITSQYSEVAEMIEPLPGGFDDLGGMERVKQWFRDEVIAPIRSGDTKRVPKGILLAGPPGTGKTFLARALAQEAGFNAVALNAANILGKYVGESEGRLKSFFSFARSLEPTIIFIDEIDETDMARRSGDGGNPVAGNLFNALMQFASDETLRGRVILLFATNRPDRLDAALKRNGRMDAIIPILLPDAQEREAVALAHARTHGYMLGPLDLRALVDGTAKYNNADIGAVIKKAQRLQERGIVDPVKKALDFIRPDLSMADYYTKLAIQAVNDRELLPPEYAGMLNDRKGLGKEIDAAAPDSGRRVRREA